MNKRLISLTMLILLMSSTAFAVESLSELERRVGLESIDDALKSGNRNVLLALPAKGYKNGLTGVLNKFDVYPNPAYSFTSCGITDKAGKNGPSPGCVVSIKLAQKSSGGMYRDIGIRIEYAIGPGDEKFTPNNSAYAEHIVRGDGVLEAQIQSY